MSDLLCNGAPVLAATIVMPRIGAWYADLEVDTADASKVTGAITLQSSDGVTWKGTSIRAGIYAEKASLRMVGGDAGLAKTLPAKYYADVPLRVALGDLLGEAGEVASTTIAQSVLDHALATWTRAEWQTSQGLDELFDLVDLTWRVLPDGTIWAGPETWTEASPKFELVTDERSNAYAVIAPESPALLPGMTLMGRKVARVVHRQNASQLRAEVWFEDERPDPMAGAMRAMIRQELRELRFLRRYGARVVSQAADGTLDLELDDQAMPTMTGVPIRVQIPGTTIKVSPNARCIVQFENTKPPQPYVAEFASGATLEVKIAGGSRRAARVGDATRTTINLVPAVGPAGPIPGAFSIAIRPGTMPPPFLDATGGLATFVGGIGSGSSLAKLP